MNVLIVGNSEINEALEQQMVEAGFQANIIPDYNEIIKLKGEPGKFVAQTQQSEFHISSIVITERPKIEEIAVGTNKTMSLLDGNILDTIEADESDSQVVILLDYDGETPEYITMEALKISIELREKRRKVVFLSKFVKTSATDMEKVYRKARQAGVTFIKYETASLNFNEESNQFTIRAFDGVFETCFETNLVLSAGKEDISTLHDVMKKFRLSVHNNGMINGNKYFLNPAFTSRKGVFYYHPGLSQMDKVSGAKAILPTIIAQIKEIASNPSKEVCASIDSEKCAFCYSCYRVCPHAALEPDIEKNAMSCTESACEACGTCAAICPGEAITMKSETGLSSSTMQSQKSDKCKVFCCENSAYSALLEMENALGDDWNKLDISVMPCGGRLGQDMITTALGAHDKVLVATCVEDACRHMVGDKRACQHVEKVIATINKMNLTNKKVACTKVSHAMGQVLVQRIKDFLKETSVDDKE